MCTLPIKMVPINYGTFTYYCRNCSTILSVHLYTVVQLQTFANFQDNRLNRGEGFDSNNTEVFLLTNFDLTTRYDQVDDMYTKYAEDSDSNTTKLAIQTDFLCKMSI